MITEHDPIMKRLNEQFARTFAQDSKLDGLKQITNHLRAMAPHMESLGSAVKDFRMDHAAKMTYAEDFTSYAGNDIEICVCGNFENDDPSVGFRGGYTIERVWLANDASQTDISSLISEDRLAHLTDEGTEIISQRLREAAADFNEN